MKTTTDFTDYTDLGYAYLFNPCNLRRNKLQKLEREII